jgi:hypothetical protein
MKPGNTLTLMTALAVGLVSYASQQARAQTWDVLNETYGSGAGELSFISSYNFVFGSDTPAETLSAGKATLTIPKAGSGVAVVYPYKPANLPAWDTDTEVTIEWKVAFRQGASALVTFSQTEDKNASAWGGYGELDMVYPTTYTLNAIADYGRRITGENLAPSGFDSSVPHIYRFVRQGGVNSLYLDNYPVPLISPMVNFAAAAAGDGYRWGWAFYKNAASDSEVDMYYLKIAHGPFPPPDTIAPNLVSASRDPTDLTKVAVQFSEAVQTSTATNIGNYSVNFGGPVLAAARTAPANVLLTLTSALVGTVTNILTVTGVQDLASNSIAPGSQLTISVPTNIWNVMDENYGNGPGEVSFTNSYYYDFTSTAPDETLSAGKSTMNLPQGSYRNYPCKTPTSLPAWAGGGADVTIEWKFAFHGGASANVYVAENQSGGSWGHILSFERDYAANYQANEIVDYYMRDAATNLAPAGFDGGLPHIYRLVRQGDVNSLYLDGQLLKQALTSGPGAAGDAYRLYWGFYENVNSPSSVDVYYFKAANGAVIPGPADNTAPTAVSAIRGITDYMKVTVVYSERVQAGTAINTSHYSINHGGPVLAVSEINSTTFLLTLSSSLSDTVVNTLTINGVKDLAGNSIALNTQVTVNTALWDVIDEKYGNGAGEVSFNASYDYALFGKTPPLETLSPGKATLSLDQGAGYKYPVKPASVPAWQGGGAEVTIEWKLAFHNGAGGHLWLSENEISGLSGWGHILSFNNNYTAGGAYEANYIEDYYMGANAVNLAPPGFDSSQPHVYRIVRKAGTDSWYLDGQLLKQALVNGPGAAGDGVIRLEWGFNENPDTPSSIDMYYFRAAKGALVPQVTLAFVRNGNQLTFSWDAEGYALQENSVLTDTVGWTNTPGGSVSGVSVTMGSGNKFFRLEQQ